MRPFIYLLIFVFAFILFKAFYLDSLPSEPDVDTNATSAVEGVSDTPEANATVHESTKEDPHPTGWADKSGRPIDQLGDSIAEKFKGKL